jgi:hypothetical protein
MSSKFQFDVRTMLAVVAVMTIGFATYPVFRIYAIIVPFAYLAFVSGLFLLDMGRFRQWLCIAMLLGIPVISFADALFHGPFAQWHNIRLGAIASDMQLIGQSQSIVPQTLGEPTSVYPTDGDGTTTFNYAPFRWFSGAQLQVHCRDGKVISIELLDD